MFRYINLLCDSGFEIIAEGAIVAISNSDHGGYAAQITVVAAVFHGQGCDQFAFHDAEGSEILDKDGEVLSLLMQRPAKIHEKVTRIFACNIGAALDHSRCKVIQIVRELLNHFLIIAKVIHVEAFYFLS